MASGGYQLRLIQDSIASDGELPYRLTASTAYLRRARRRRHRRPGIRRRPGVARARRGRMTAGSSGCALWRWELAPTASAAVLGAAPAAASSVKLNPRAEAAHAESLLMRCDSVAFPPGGCAYLHTHQGPGIRCLIDGGIRIDTEGTSHCHAPGGAWFEAGPAPVFAQAADRPTRLCASWCCRHTCWARLHRLRECRGSRQARVAALQGLPGCAHRPMSHDTLADRLFREVGPRAEGVV